MIRHQAIFAIAGFVAGALTAALGALSPIVLAVGAGPLFFGGILAAIVLTNSWPCLSRYPSRYAGAACLCLAVYVLALFVFNVTIGYFPQLLGVRGSTDIVEFRLDVWLGLVGAVFVASAGCEWVAHLLIGKWSNVFWGRLAMAGFVAVLVTFVANFKIHHYWSFIGVLLPVGEGLYSGVIGAQIWETLRRSYGNSGHNTQTP